MDEYLHLTLVARPGESAAAFGSRLTAFWTHVLRTRPADYARVYAEATRYGTSADRVTRQYMVEAGAIGALTGELTAAGVGFESVDEADTYTKYEASPPDWFQIAH